VSRQAGPWTALDRLLLASAGPTGHGGARLAAV